MSERVRPPVRRPPPRRAPAARRRAILPAWGWKVWVPLLIGAATLPFVIGYAIAVFVLFPPPPVSEPGTAVPDLVGMTTADAQRELAGLGLGVLQMTPLPHETAPAGTIIAQSPLPGQQLRAGASVSVAASTGVPRARVPDVATFPVARAQNLLIRLGFEVVRSDEISVLQPPGRVLRTEPPAGSELALPDTVHLFVAAPDTMLTPPVVDTLASVRLR